MAESVPLEEPENRKMSKSVRYLKMKVLENHKAEGVDEVVKKSLDGKNIIFSDKSTSYVNINDYVEVHVSKASNQHTTNHTLKWVHIAIVNLKRNLLLGVYHKIRGEYLQSYLSEFCYKLSRRCTLEKNYLIDLSLLPLMEGGK